MIKILNSNLDASVNFVHTDPNGNTFESRFVQRSNEYFSVYLSSQAGCAHACRMCHLTQTGQTNDIPALEHDFIAQVIPALEHYDKMPYALQQAKKIHFNFMARGEPLSENVGFLEYCEYNYLVDRVIEECKKYYSTKNLEYRFNISTIMPDNERIAQAWFWRNINQFIDPKYTTIYYSLYSLDVKFRKRWLPKSFDPLKSLDILRSFKDAGGDAKIHYALIANENDGIGDAYQIAQVLNSFGLDDIDVNLVMYNPFSDWQGKESGKYKEYKDYFQAIHGGLVRVIPRVGYDVNASCGMFSS